MHPEDPPLSFVLGSSLLQDLREGFLIKQVALYLICSRARLWQSHPTPATCTAAIC